MEVMLSAQSAAASVPIEKRSAHRFPAAQVPSITGLRVSPHGTDGKLVNISATGILAECGMRLKVGSAATITFEGTFRPSSVAARVVRCAVAAMGKNGTLLYHVGFAFDARIPFDGPDGTAKADPAAAPPDLAPVRHAVRNRW